MKIYAVGDSFTAGAELADHEFNLPGYPGFCRFSDRESEGNIYTKWGNSRHDFIKDNSQIMLRERELSYPQQLGNILNLPVINNGIGGCSMQTIQRNLHKFLQTNKEPVYIFFQPTHWARWSQFYENTWRDFLTTMTPDSMWHDLAGMFKFRVLNENTYSWVEQWFAIFYSCIELIRKNDLVRGYWIMDAGFLQELSSLCRVMYSPLGEELADRVLNYIKIINDRVQVMDLAKDFGNDRPEWLCPGGHFNYHVHEKLAQHLAHKIQHGLS